MASQDRIERVMTVRAPRERVWTALTTASGLSQWFGSSAEVELRLGGEILFSWGEDRAARARIEEVEPPRRFAYRWQAIGTERDHPAEAGPKTRVELTLVEFTLDEVPEGTRLTLVESGFASLPAEFAAKAFAHSTEGWTMKLDELAAYVTATPLPVETA